VDISRRTLPEEVQRNREAYRAQNERLEEVAKPRIEAQLQACRMAVEQLEAWHRRIADETDLDPTGYSRGAAVWLLSGRAIGFLKALIVLAEAGIEVEAMAIGRALHEADHMLLAFCAPDGEAVVRRWLDDEGKHGYVKPGESRKAQASFEEEMEEAMQAQGLPSLGRTGPLADELYDRMSRVAHSRRSTCVSSFSEPLREFAYGTHPFPVRRGIVVEWTSTMTVEVLNSVGDALRAFYGQGFFTEKVAPLVHSVDAVRESCPLDEDSILAAAS
jgi:hypothetical protein